MSPTLHALANLVCYDVRKNEIHSHLAVTMQSLISSFLRHIYHLQLLHRNAQLILRLVVAAPHPPILYKLLLSNYHVGYIHNKLFI